MFFCVKENIKMFIKILDDDQKIICQLVLENLFIAINSNTLINSLVVVDSNLSYADLRLLPIEHLKNNLFPIKPCNSK